MTQKSLGTKTWDERRAVPNAYDFQVNVKNILEGICICVVFPVNKWLFYQLKDLANVIAPQMCNYMHWIMMHPLLMWWQAGLVWPTLTFHCTSCYCHNNSFTCLIFLSLNWLQQPEWDQIVSNAPTHKRNWSIAYWIWIYHYCVLGPKLAVFVFTYFLPALQTAMAR